MGEPLAAGAVHETLTWVLALVPVTPVGALGRVAGVTELEGIEGSLLPTPLEADTRKV